MSKPETIDLPGPSGDSKGDDLGSLARGGVFVLVGSVVTGVSGFLLTVLVTRGVPSSTVGVLFASISLFMIAFTIVRMGASTGAVYFLSRFSALGEYRRFRGVIRSALTPVAVFSFAMAALVLVLAEPLARLFVPGHQVEAASAMRVMAVFLPFAALADVCMYGARGLHRLRPLVLIDKIGRPLLQLGAVGLAVAIGATSARDLAFGWAVPYLPAAVIAAVWLWVLLGRVETHGGLGTPDGAEPEPERGGAMYGEFWRYTWPRWPQSISQIALQRLDILLVLAILGPSEAAIYAAVTRFLVFGQIAAGSIGAVAQPRFGHLLALKDAAGVRTVYRASTTWLILVCWPLYLGFVAFAGYLPLIFGPQYSVGTTVLVILGLTMLVATGCGLVDVVLAMAGRTTWTLANSLASLAINVSFDLVLIPRLGITGAAIGWSCAILFNNLVPLAQVGWVVHLHPFGRSTLLASVLSVGCLGVVPIAVALSPAGLAPLIVVWGIGLVCYTALVWHFRTTLHLDVLLAGRRGR